MVAGVTQLDRADLIEGVRQPRGTRSATPPGGSPQGHQSVLHMAVAPLPGAHLLGGPLGRTCPSGSTVRVRAVPRPVYTAFEAW